LHSLYKARENNKKQGSSVSQSQKEKQLLTPSGQCAWTLQSKQIWHSNGCNLDNIESWYQHGTNGTVQRVHRSCRTLQPVLDMHTIW
jgi:hypothetical protein